MLDHICCLAPRQAQALFFQFKHHLCVKCETF